MDDILCLHVHCYCTPIAGCIVGRGCCTGTRCQSRKQLRVWGNSGGENRRRGAQLRLVPVTLGIRLVILLTLGIILAMLVFLGIILMVPVLLGIYCTSGTSYTKSYTNGTNSARYYTIATSYTIIFVVLVTLGVSRE